MLTLTDAGNQELRPGAQLMLRKHDKSFQKLKIFQSIKRIVLVAKDTNNTI